MITNKDDAGDDMLAEIDLHVWRVPPPAPVHRPSLLVRALSPAATPTQRPRLAWLVAGSVALNAAIAILIVILLGRPSESQHPVVVQPAGGGTDAQVSDVLQRLEREQRGLERKLAEIEELRALVVELSERIRKYEQLDGTRDRTLPKKREPTAPEPLDPRAHDQRPLDPFGQRDPTTSTPPPAGCDEVSCVLSNYAGACCAKFRAPSAPVISVKPSLPESLDRQLVTNAIVRVKARVLACAQQSQAKGKVKIRVTVEPSGSVRTVTIESTPDAALGSCVAVVIQRAVFPRTQYGGAFSYPFIF
jgi:hypothetical protein